MFRKKHENISVLGNNEESEIIKWFLFSILGRDDDFEQRCCHGSAQGRVEQDQGRPRQKEHWVRQSKGQNNSTQCKDMCHASFKSIIVVSFTVYKGNDLCCFMYSVEWSTVTIEYTSFKVIMLSVVLCTVWSAIQ